MSYVLCLAILGLPDVNVDLFIKSLKLICSVELFLMKNLFYQIAEEHVEKTVKILQ
jgi:hypothetical protein